MTLAWAGCKPEPESNTPPITEQPEVSIMEKEESKSLAFPNGMPLDSMAQTQFLPLLATPISRHINRI